jgi:uncharacterized protein (UPF0335 family)
MTDSIIDMPGAEDAATRLKTDLERYEDLDRERADLGEHQKALLEHLKADGYDTAVFKKIVALRKKNPSDLEEQAQLLDLYTKALGIELKGVIA